MALIIAATDYSYVGDNAVRYACQLAMAQNARLVVIHSFIFPVMFNDFPLPATLVNEAQADAEAHMNHLVGDMQARYPGVMIEGKVDYGEILSTLDRYSAENTHPWLIVVGNSAAGDKSTWPDNTIIDALKTLKYPVLAVPQHAEYNPVQKICFAFDNKQGENEVALEQLIAISRALNAELHILNAQTGENRNEEPEIDEEARQILAGSNPHYHILYNKDIDAAIQQFIDEHKMDWLMLLPRKHSFFEGLFHKSHTKAIAHNCSIPIVALHEKLG